MWVRPSNLHCPSADRPPEDMSSGWSRNTCYTSTTFLDADYRRQASDAELALSYLAIDTCTIPSQPRRLTIFVL